MNRWNIETHARLGCLLLLLSAQLFSADVLASTEQLTVTWQPMTTAVGATEVDLVTWQPMGIAPATEVLQVTWQPFTSLAVGTQTIAGEEIASDGSATFTAAQVAQAADGVSIAGLSIITPPSGWNVTGQSGVTTTLTSTSANTAVPAPSTASSGSAAGSPTFTITTTGTPGIGGNEIIGGFMVSSIAAGYYTAAQVATVAGGGSVPNLVLSTSTPSAWTIGAASGATTLFTSTTPNHAEPGPAGATSSAFATAPTFVQVAAGVTPMPAGETIGGMTVTGSNTASYSFTAAQVAQVAGGGTVAGLTITTAPTTWTVSPASGATTVFTSTTANAPVATPSDAGFTGTAAAPTFVVRTLGKSVPTLGLSSSANSVTSGTSVTFTATLTGASSPTGNVTFCADATTVNASCTGGLLLCTVPVTSIPPSCSTAFVGSGSHTMGAYFAGDANNEPASASIALAVAALTPAPMLDRWAMLLLCGLFGAVAFVRLRRV
jgi:hypothetical protein